MAQRGEKKMEKVRNSSVLKVLCYIMIPILVAIFGLSVFHLAFLNEFGNKKEEVKYTQTENFANNYLYFFLGKVYYCEPEVRDKKFRKLENQEGDLYCYFDEGRNYDSSQVGNYIKYVIVEKATGDLFTNIKSGDYQQVMSDMQNQKIYWNFVDGKVDTNLSYINQDNIKYSYCFNDTQESNEHDYDIYSFFDEEEATIASNFLFDKTAYDFMLQHRDLPICGCIFSVIVLLMIAFYLFCAIGYKKGESGICLNTLDKIPYEIICAICVNVIAIAATILVSMTNDTFSYYYIVIGFFLIFYIVGYIACAVWGITTIKRIKAKTFWKSFLTYKIMNWLVNKKMKKYAKEFSQKTSSGQKIFWYYWGFVVISVVLACLLGSATAIIALILFWLWVFYRIKKYTRQQDEIKEALEKIYQGNNEIYLNDSELQGVQKEMAVYINDIAGGFSNAIEESLKSERLKTELITNVSHDIKTPLTSIINYVDLLKKEELQDERIREYVEILDMKSQRLKKLTEDLVEASKVSSGNVKLTIEEINLKELINQSIGEFKDRFEEKGLQIESNMPEGIKVKADNRYLYRVIENLFSNITKYALENSRVYIDITKEKNKISISMKNISKEKLNISSDELMQRFVRGDKARYTEGSGLGLSIAKSLTELQGGTFDIYIDGDLFKVVIEW